jgi:hypothetical protein
VSWQKHRPGIRFQHFSVSDFQPFQKVTLHCVAGKPFGFTIYALPRSVSISAFRPSQALA